MKVEDVNKNHLVTYLNFRYPLSNYNVDMLHLREGIEVIIVSSCEGTDWGFTKNYYQQVIEFIVSIERENRINRILE